MQLSEYLHDPTEYGLHINTHVSLWLHSRSYDNKPLLVQAFGFVIVTEEIHEEFDAFVTSMPLLTQGCYLQCGPLLQYWNMHMRPTPASVVNLFTNEYLYLHYSDVDNLCEWVLNAREEYEKHAMFGQSAVEHHEESEIEGTVTKRKGSSSMTKLWIKFCEVQLYEADRYNLSSIIKIMIDLPFFCSELFLKATIPG